MDSDDLEALDKHAKAIESICAAAHLRPSRILVEWNDGQDGTVYPDLTVEFYDTIPTAKEVV